MNPDEISSTCQVGLSRKRLAVAQWLPRHLRLCLMPVALWRCMLIWLLGMGFTSVSAEIYRCQAADGSAVFQDYPCHAKSRPIDANARATPTPVAPAPAPSAAAAPAPSLPAVPATPVVTPHRPEFAPIKPITPPPEPTERPSTRPPVTFDEPGDEAKTAKPNQARPTPPPRSIFKDAMAEVLKWVSYFIAFFSLAGSVTFFGSHLPSTTLMPCGKRNGGDLLFGRFWWRNLALAAWGTCVLLPMYWEMSGWAHYTKPAFSIEQWQILVPLWVVTVAWFIAAWFLVKSSLIAGYPRRYSLWGQYAWLDEWMGNNPNRSTGAWRFFDNGTSGSPTEPLGNWYPSTHPIHGPEEYYWVALHSLDDIRKESKVLIYFVVVLLVLGTLGSLFASGGWQEASWVMLFFAFCCLSPAAKQAAHVYHHRVMAQWANNPNP